MRVAVFLSATYSSTLAIQKQLHSRRRHERIADRCWQSRQVPRSKLPSRDLEARFFRSLPRLPLRLSHPHICNKRDLFQRVLRLRPGTGRRCHPRKLGCCQRGGDRRQRRKSSSACICSSWSLCGDFAWCTSLHPRDSGDLNVESSGRYRSRLRQRRSSHQPPPFSNLTASILLDTKPPLLDTTIACHRLQPQTSDCSSRKCSGSAASQMVAAGAHEALNA